MLVVTATELARLMPCNGSRLMAGFVPVVERDDTTRREGDAAHWFIKEVHEKRFSPEELIDRRAPNGVYITPEIMEHTSEYLEFMQGGDVEVDTTYSNDDWKVNGRADGTKFKENTLYISDFKYGWSIVDPEKNWTLISHAIGEIRKKYSHRNDVKNIEFTIFQPRAYHPVGRVRSWNISYEELFKYYQEIWKTLSNPSDILNTGKHCYKCPAMISCPAARSAQMNGIEMSSHSFVDNISNSDLSFQLDQITRAMEMLKQNYDAFSDLAIHRLREGQVINNYSLHKSISNRNWKEGLNAEFLKNLTGIDLRKNELITPAQSEKLGVPKLAVAAIVERKETATKLVRIDASSKAEKMFTTKGN